MKYLAKQAIMLFIAGCCMTSCASYDAEDYVNDMKALTEETIRNASTYTEEDWERVGERYKDINEKGRGLLEKLSEEQKRELEKFSEEMADKAAEFDHEELKEQFKNALDEANDFLEGIMKQIKNK